MAAGFIHDKLEIKFLILYIAARVSEPLPPEGMQELTMCDDGIDYFAYAECLNDLVRTEHLRLTEDGCYAITPKGLKNSEICESSLPYSVRLRTDKNVGGIQPPPAAEEPGPESSGQPRKTAPIWWSCACRTMWTVSCTWSSPPPPRPWPGIWRTGSGRTRRASTPGCCRPCTPPQSNKQKKRGERRSPRFYSAASAACASSRAAMGPAASAPPPPFSTSTTKARGRSSSATKPANHAWGD